MSTFRRYLRLVKCGIVLDIKKMSYFRVDSVLDILTNILIIGINIFFWRILFENKYNIPNWTYRELIVFTAFSELFFSIKSGLFSASTKFWILIVSGKLDVYLIRPVNPKFKAIVLNTHITELIKGFIMFTALMIFSGIRLKISGIAVGIVLCFVAAVFLSLLEFMIGYLSFRFGRIETIVEIIDSLVQFNKYPLDMMPGTIFKFFKFIIPFAFFSTIPAMISIKLISIGNICSLAGILLVLTIIWGIVDMMLWRRGLKYYESYNG